MLMRNFHERAPVRLLDGSLISVMGEFGQLNQEELKPETELKALRISFWSVLLHVDSAEAKREMTTKALNNISILQLSSTYRQIYTEERES